MVAQFNAREPLHQRVLLLGALQVAIGVSEGSQPSWRSRCPSFEALLTLFPEGAQARGILHFWSPGGPRRDELQGYLDFVPNLAGFQINGDWPTPSEIVQLKARALGGLIIGLQLGPAVVPKLAGRCRESLNRIKQFDGLADYLLIDGSAGRGKPLDVAMARDAIVAMKSAGIAADIGVAGGLDGSTLMRLVPLLEEWPTLSWDAEARLRTQDVLDLEKVDRYVATSAALLTTATNSRTSSSGTADSH